MANTPPTACQTAFILSQHLYLKVVLAIKIGFSLSGLLMTSIHIVKRGITWLVHPNAKALYCFHIFWAIFVPSMYFVVYSIDLARLIFISSDDPCDHAMSTFWAVFLPIFPVLGLVAQSFTMFSFAIERLIATVIPAKYEKTKSPCLGIILGIISPILSITMGFRLILMPIDWNSIQPMTSLRTDENVSSFILFLNLTLFLEITTFSLFTLTLLRNYGFFRRRNQVSRSTSLASRYQINENKHLILTLLPCFVAHFLLNLMPILGLKFYFLFFHFDEGSYAAWAELWTQAQMYSVVMPLLIHLRLKFRRSKEITNNHNTTAHFQQLHSIFNQS